MGGLQIPSCSNCRHRRRGRIYQRICDTCIDLSKWKSKRGAKAGASRKPGAGRTPFEDQGEKRQAMILSFKANDVTKAGGYKKVKADLEKAFYDKINKSN